MSGFLLALQTIVFGPVQMLFCPVLTFQRIEKSDLQDSVFGMALPSDVTPFMLFLNKGYNTLNSELKSIHPQNFTSSQNLRT